MSSDEVRIYLMLSVQATSQLCQELDDEKRPQTLRLHSKHSKYIVPSFVGTPGTIPDDESTEGELAREAETPFCAGSVEGPGMCTVTYGVSSL